MTIIKYLTILCLTMLCTVPAYPQQRQTEVCIDFRVNSTVIDTTYMDNAVRMRELTDFLRAVRQDSTVLLLGVTYRGAASPEDSNQTNRSLARGRIAALEEPVAEAADTLQLGDTIPEQAGEGFRNIHIKTNLAGLAMGIANVAAEMDLARHWSFSLPVYYSAWNYFTSTVKFRTFALQPELRYWPSDANCGFFAGGHFGMAYYNLAFGGDYRYQDHNRETPAIGGGLSVGYRLPISKNGRWRMEFSLGAGGYALEYDKFHNTPNTKDGLMVESGIRKTYWGIDRAALSFSYSFDLSKKGGQR